jgi:hypothetical protein
MDEDTLVSLPIVASIASNSWRAVGGVLEAEVLWSVIVVEKSSTILIIKVYPRVF